MKKADVKIGSTYIVKVSGKLVKVRITGDLGTYIIGWSSPRGMTTFKRPVERHRGWAGVNLATNRDVHIRTAAKLRSEVKS